MFINSSYYCIDEYSPPYQLYFVCVFYCKGFIKEMVNKQMCNCVILYMIKIFTYSSCSNFSNCLLAIINNMISTNNPPNQECFQICSGAGVILPTHFYVCPTGSVLGF